MLHRKILVPYDFSENAKQALTTALRLSYRFGSEVLILTVIEPTPEGGALKPLAFSENAGPRLERKIEEDARSIISWAERSSFNFRPALRQGRASEEILAAAEEWRPDLIVMGSKGATGIKRVFLGSVAERVLRQAVAPVWVCRRKTKKLPRKILVPADFSANSREALRNAVAWSRELDAELLVLNVSDIQLAFALDPRGFESHPSWEARLLQGAEKELEKWAKPIAPSAKLRTRAGNPLSEILETVREEGVDLVILSTHGRRGWKSMFLGSVAEQVLRYSPCSVMTVCPASIAATKAAV